MIASFKILYRISLCSVLVALSALSARTQAALDVDKVEKSIVRVVIGGHGTGWVVSPGIVATNWHVAEGNTTYEIYPAGTNDVYTGTLRWLGNDELDLALIDVPGLPMEPFTIHKSDTPRGTPVYTVGFPGLGDDFSGRANLNVSTYGGTLALMVENAAGVRIIQHDNIVNAGNSGGPLLDDCGRVLGLTTWGRENSDIAADFIWASVHVAELADVMDGLGIAYTDDSSACVTSSGTSTMIATGPDADEVQAIVRENTAAISASVNERVAAVALESTEQMDAIADQMVLWGSVGGGVLLLTLLLALRKPRQQIIYALEQASRKVRGNPEIDAVLASRGNKAAPARHGLVISGTSPSGAPVRIVLEQRVLDNATKGISVGRDAAIVDYSFADQALSRRHARFSWKADKVQLEDLNSTNGTVLNGRQLDAYTPVVLNVGDSIKLGNISFQVSKFETS